MTGGFIALVAIVVGLMIGLVLFAVDFLELPRFRLRFGGRKTYDHDKRTDYDE